MAYRAIHDDVPASDSLNSVSDFAERLYWRLLACSDTCGRGPGTVTKIATLCIPRLAKTEDELRAALEQLVRVGRLQLYCVTGTWAYQIVDFDERQPVSQFGRRMSRFPAPPSDAVQSGADHGSPGAALAQLELADPVPPTDAAPSPEGAVPDGSLTQLDVGSAHTEQTRAEKRRAELQTSQFVAPPSRPRHDERAALEDESIEELGRRLVASQAEVDGVTSPLVRLLQALPDRDENTGRVLRKLLEGLPDHAADFVRMELEAADGVRSPTRYAVGILKRWDSRRQTSHRAHPA